MTKDLGDGVRHLVYLSRQSYGGVTRAETKMQNKNNNFFIVWFLSCLQALQSPYDTDVVIPALSIRPPTSWTVHHKYLLC